MIAAVGNTQTLTALAIDSQALPPADQARVATVLLNDLLSEATFCATPGSTGPPQTGSLCWNARGHNSGGMVGIKAILDALQLLGRSTELLETLSQTEYPSLGNFVTAGATALWSDWGDRMTEDGTYYSGVKQVSGLQCRFAVTSSLCLACVLPRVSDRRLAITVRRRLLGELLRGVVVARSEVLLHGLGGDLTAE